MKKSKERIIITLLNIIGVTAIFAMATFDRIKAGSKAEKPNDDVKIESQDNGSGECGHMKTDIHPDV
ncbi:MAG: hypothetical protein K9M57_10290 [Phycisphaerae bacterium]|nr:hypothetical protein [Phycisphaerae bacterium]